MLRFLSKDGRRGSGKFRVALLSLFFALACAGSARADDAQMDKARTAFIHADYSETFRLALPLAQSGNADAQAFVGSLYAYGRGTHKDASEAARWFKLAAENGNAGAQYALGSMYLSGGGGLAYDPIKAAYWVEKASEQDFDLAQFMLSRMYAEGLGVTNDPEKAAMWKQRFDAQMKSSQEFFKQRSKK